MAEVATAPDNRRKLVAGTRLVTAEMVAALEGRIDDLGGRFEMPTEFVVPGPEPAVGRPRRGPDGGPAGRAAGGRRRVGRWGPGGPAGRRRGGLAGGARISTGSRTCCGPWPGGRRATSTSRPAAPHPGRRAASADGHHRAGRSPPTRCRGTWWRWGCRCWPVPTGPSCPGWPSARWAGSSCPAAWSPWCSAARASRPRRASRWSCDRRPGGRPWSCSGWVSRPGSTPSAGGGPRRRSSEAPEKEARPSWWCLIRCRVAQRTRWGRRWPRGRCWPPTGSTTTGARPGRRRSTRSWCCRLRQTAGWRTG